MKHKALRFSSVLAGIAFLAVFFGAAIYNTPTSEAISALDFKAGNIIDDGVFYNKNTMTVAEIQAHLNRYMPACDTWGTGAVGSGRYINGKAVPASTTRAEYARQMRAAGNTRYHEPPYVCVQNYYENPTTHETLFETKNVIKDGMISAAQIIYNASQKYGINPQVLLVLLKKESYVWGDNWPLKNEYNTVMGYACPDTAPCDSKYFGFYNQVEMAAWQLNYYKEHIYSYNYRPYATNSILYSPTTSCGRKSVYLENLATTSLYIYTPYTPNDAALRNYPGTATCGSYGNRNFFMYFSEWFGDTHGFNAAKRTIPDYDYKILSTDKTKSLHISEDSDEAGINVVADSSDSTTMAFSFTRNSDNSYHIVNKSTGLALDIPQGDARVGKDIKTWTSNTSIAQKWFIYGSETGGYYIGSAANPSHILAIDDTTGKVVLDIYGSQSSKPLMLAPITENGITNGVYTIHSALDKNFTLTSINGNIAGYKANNSDAQKIRISLENDGFYKLELADKKVITADSTSVKNSTNVQASDDKNECTQRFLIIKNNTTGRYSIHSACDLSYSFDVAKSSTQDGTNIILYTYDNSKLNQEWWFEATEVASIPEQSPASTTEKKEESTSTATETTTKQPIADGKYVIRSALRVNYALDVLKASTLSGANVNTWTRNGSVAQIFTLKYNASKDAYSIINANSGNALDLSGGVATNNANVQVYRPNESCAQYWKIIKKNKNYAIISTCNTNYALDVARASTTDGANIIVYTYDNSKLNQEWWFEAM